MQLIEIFGSHEIKSSHPVKIIKDSTFYSSASIKTISDLACSKYILLQLKQCRLEIDDKALNLVLKELENAEASLAYTPYFETKDAVSIEHPVIEYQEGSIRDDFDFGALVILKTSCLKEFQLSNPDSYNHAGWYDLRLFLNRIKNSLLINKAYYTIEENDIRKSGEKQFDYVNPMNRERQLEMETVATKHLKHIGAMLQAPFKTVDFDTEGFEIEASVIIPVLNREKTISDAINSVLNQKCQFNFNLIIVDNHSTDQTGAIIHSFKSEKIIHHIPLKTNLGIGGCWNEGINHPNCGRFAIQLDSDDLYLNENTLQTIVDKFHAENCAMVIGSYQMVNFNLQEIPPGIIDHKEWTDNNGSNNALRINGLGAPRAFYTPVIRKIKFPNVSYGEDYAVGLAISRTYKIGRIYDPLYLCRRWDDNTDASLSIDKLNAHNFYKDSLRTIEIEKRKQL